MPRAKTKAVSQRLFLLETRLSMALRPLLESDVHADCIVVWVSPDVTVANAYDRISFSMPPAGSIRSTVLIYEGIPINADSLTGWRSHILQHQECEVRCLFLTGSETVEDATQLFQQKATNLIGAIPSPEAKAVGLGEWVKAPERPQGNGMILTMFFDSLGELLTQMDAIKRRFREIATITHRDREEYHDNLELLLGLDTRLKETRADRDVRANGLNAKFESTRQQRDCIPRVLLLGETGVGKTLFANHLGDGATPVTRISIAEFINKEDMFEYALFGYCKGAYTSAKEEGDPGLLLNNIGGVIFLDEIGTATPTIQAKLLAYLDDFMVRPRGMTRNALFCPTLIVAATNEDITGKGDKEYRKDLLQRFTDIHPIPPLRMLKHNFRYLVDIHLQNPAINPFRGVADKKSRVTEVGEAAFARLASKDYEAGNFRELGNVMREACRQAMLSGRHYLLESDIRADADNTEAE